MNQTALDVHKKEHLGISNPSVESAEPDDIVEDSHQLLASEPEDAVEEHTQDMVKKTLNMIVSNDNFFQGHDEMVQDQECLVAMSAVCKLFWPGSCYS